MADSVVAEVKALPTTRERLDTYRAVLRRAGATGQSGLAIALCEPFAEAAKGLGTERATLAAIEDLLNVVDRTGFAPHAATHFEMAVARMQAFLGNIDAGERRLSEILARAPAELHDHTAAEAHYGAAYCAYYSDRLEHGAIHITAAAKLYEALGMDARALAAYDGATATYLKIGLADTALRYARRGIALNGRLEDEVTLNLALNYAEALVAVGQVDSALHYATRAEAFAPILRHDGMTARVSLALGNINMAIRRYGRAADYYLRADSVFQRADEAYEQSTVLDSLGIAYAHIGRFEEAYRLRTRSFHLRDSLREDRTHKDTYTLVAERERDALASELATSEVERALAEAKVAHRATERLALGATATTLLLALAWLLYRARVRKRAAETLRRLVSERTRELRDHGEALETQAARLAASNAELERFAYIASHDLKTPLRNVTSFLGLVRRRLPPESLALVGEYLDIAEANSRHMNGLITDVLEFSRLNADMDAHAEPTRIVALVDEVRSELSATLAERAGAVEVAGATEAEVCLPRALVRQLLANLIGNGIKYNRAASPTVRVVVEDMGDRVRIAIADNGIGIDPAYHERIFEVFRRLHTTDEYEGTGVGLATCRKILLRLGGEIAVASTEGKGSVFTVDLPKQHPSSPPPPTHRPSVATTV